MFDIHEESAVVHRAVHSFVIVHPDEVYCDSLCSKPTSSAYAMKVGLWVSREIVVYDKVYLLDVDSSAE